MKQIMLFYFVFFFNLIPSQSVLPLPKNYFLTFTQKWHVIYLRAQARYRRQGMKCDPIKVVDYLELPGMEVESRSCGSNLF